MSKFNRKKSFAKRFVSSLLIATLLFSTFGSPAFASDNPVSHTEESNSTFYNGNNIYASSSIAFMGAEWSSARHKWAFNYRFSGTGASRYRTTGDATNEIRIAAMEIDGTSNTDNMAIWTSNDPEYIGSAPENSGTDAYYSDIADSVVGFAITAINNLGASYAWSTYGLLSALMSTVDDTDPSDPDREWRQWEWSWDKSDVGQFFWFIVDVDPYQTVQISNEYMIFGPGYELLSAGKGYRNLEAGSPPSSASTATMSTSENWNPGMMSEEEKKKYGIEEIPRDQFEKRAKELHISKRSVKEFLNSDDEVFYYAHNFVEYEVAPSEKSPATPKGLLVKDIKAQLDKSRKVVKGFSYLDEKTEGDLNTIKKHEERKAQLQALLDRTKALSENDGKEISKVRKEFRDTILKENPSKQK